MCSSDLLPDACTNPLSDLELLAYYPCRLDCPASLERARAVAGALAQARPGVLPQIRQALSAPTLFWRLPFFATLEGRWQGGEFELDGLTVNAFPEPAARAVQGLWARHLAGLLSPGTRLARVGPQWLALTPDGAHLPLGEALLIDWQQAQLARL